MASSITSSADVDVNVAAQQIQALLQECCLSEITEDSKLLQNPRWVQNVISKSKHFTSNRGRCFKSIYRLPEYLKRYSECSYNPQIVKLGPFHRNNVKLPLAQIDEKVEAALREKVEAVLKTIVRLSKKGKKLDDLKREIRNLDIRQYYDDKAATKWDLLTCWFIMDGCFILEMLESKNLGAFLRLERWYILDDIFKLENQIPLVVLLKILELEHGSPEKAESNLSRMLFKWPPFFDVPFSLKSKSDDVKKYIPHADHLLDLVHGMAVGFLTKSDPFSLLCLRPGPVKEEKNSFLDDRDSVKTENEKITGADFLPVLQCHPKYCKDLEKDGFNEAVKKASLGQSNGEYLLQQAEDLQNYCEELERDGPNQSNGEYYSEEPWGLTNYREDLERDGPNQNDDEYYCEYLLYPAEVLHKKGIQFKPSETGVVHFQTSWFGQSILFLPQIYVDHDTEGLIRHLMAFNCDKPTKKGKERTIICQLMVLMNCLIETPNDVALLRKERILRSRIGSDEELAAMFKNLCKGTPHCFPFYEEVVGKLNKHCNKKLNKDQWISCWKDNFTQPWQIIGLLMAACMSTLTVIQAYYTAKAYYMDNP